MFSDSIKDYFDSIEPSVDLIERTVDMSKKESRKSIKLPKKTVAILIAAVVMLVGITALGTTLKIANNNKGIAKESSTGIVFDFSKAANTPDYYSKNDNELVSKLNELGYDKVVLPKELINNSKITQVGPFITQTSNVIDFESKKYDSACLQIVDNVARNDMNDFWGTGDENTIGEIKEINGIDVCLTVQGNDEMGYYPYVNYVVDDTIYCIHYYYGMDRDKAYQDGLAFINSINQ